MSFELINRNASWATAGSSCLFATLALSVFQHSGDRKQAFFRGGWGGSANVGCLVEVSTYMKLRLHILAEFGPEKRIWLSRFGACECHKAHYFKTYRMQESIMGSCPYNGSMKSPAHGAASVRSDIPY